MKVEPAAPGPLSALRPSTESPIAGAAFRRFARDLAASVKSVIPDHILGIGGGSGRERTGLADLLPELEQEIAAV